MAKGYDYARYDSFVGLGETINATYLTAGTVSQDKTNFFISNSVAPTGVAVVKDKLFVDWLAKKIYAGNNSGSWIALV